MKSYTNLKQSKKLAEILPVESADSTWKQYAIYGAALDAPEEMQYIHQETPFRFYSGFGFPCWSLAALFDLIPSKIYDSNNNSAYLWIHKDIDERQNKDNHYLAYHDPYDDFEHIETNQYDNFVDACYEMIQKLHELNLL